MNEKQIADLNIAIKKFESEYVTTVLRASLGGSRAIGLNNIKSSDYDIIAIAQNLPHNHVLYKTDFGIDISCCSEEFVFEETKKWKKNAHEYPTCINPFVKGRKDESSLQSEYARTLLLRIIASPLILREDIQKMKHEVIENSLLVLDALDYFFTRAYSNYILYLNLQKVNVRKYLQTLYGIYAMHWLLDNNSMPVFFMDIFEEYEINRTVEVKVKKLYRLNYYAESKNKEFTMKDDEINNYIEVSLSKLGDAIKSFSLSESKDRILEGKCSYESI